MSRSIEASVGRMGGKNRPDDVITIQQMLNNVPKAEGGPIPPLAVDGLCGPKTIDAIQRFQLHHFGWKGADGRVDSGGPTLAKLDEFDNPFSSGRGPAPVTAATAMFCPHLGRVLATSLLARTVLTPGRFVHHRRLRISDSVHPGAVERSTAPVAQYAEQPGCA